MKKNTFVILVIFLLIITFAVIFFIFFGQRYRERLSTYEAPRIQNTVNKEQTSQVLKMTFKRDGQKGCYEITPDGQVRIFNDCDKNPDDVFRSYNNKMINNLFDLISSGKLSTQKINGGIELVVYTTKGTFVYYLPSNNSGDNSSNDIVKEIIDIVEDIINEAPENTPSPTSHSFENSPNPTFIPTPGVSGYEFSPTPSIIQPESQGQTVPFECAFEDTSGDRKPYRVSNIVCSTEPTTPR